MKKRAAVRSEEKLQLPNLNFSFLKAINSLTKCQVIKKQTQRAVLNFILHRDNFNKREHHSKLQTEFLTATSSLRCE